jgi:hypothetical protein
MHLGCAGGLPMLHPAQALRPVEVRAAAGFSGNVAGGDLAGVLHDARIEAAATPSPHDATFARGALAAAAVGPGLAPWVAARVGLGGSFDAGLAYSGRALRADVRRAFELAPGWAASVGAGGMTVVGGHPEGGELPGVDVGALHGWGADLPVLVGFESDAQLYMAWLGARAGWEHVEVSARDASPGGGVPGLSATHYWAGGLFGIAVGFRHVHVAIEIDASYATVSGDYGGVHGSVQGFVLTPASALWWRF